MPADGTLRYSICFNYQTDSRGRDGGFEEGGIRDGGKIVDGEIQEGGCEETLFCLSLTKKTCRFTVPLAVALLNYISSGKLWRIFCQTGVFSTYISSISLVGSAQL